MTVLTDYLTDTQLLLNQTNPAQPKFTQVNLINYINRARTEVASKGQCVRFLPPISAGIKSATILSSGTSYGAPPILTVSPPDQTPGIQATLACTLSGGTISAVQITNPGSGYFSPSPPTITVGTSASGATGNITCALDFINQTVENQEVYQYKSITLQSGMSQIVAVRSVSFIWGNFRYMRLACSFSKYQALVRNYTSGWTFVPSVVAQFNQGASGTLYMYPIPNAPYQMEWDCLILPTPMASDTDPEVIPAPWTGCVPYFAAYLAFLQVNRFDDAEKLLKLFEKFMMEARAQSQVGSPNSWYGRF